MLNQKGFILALFITLTEYVASFQILAIISLPIPSHYIAFQHFFKELAIKGHTVTVMNNFPDESPVPNLRFVNLQSDGFSRRNHKLEFFENIDSSYLHLYNAYRHVIFSSMEGHTDCTNLFENANSKAHLAEGIKYDLIFVEQFAIDCSLAYALAMFDAPIIGLTSHVLLPWAYPRMGFPFDVTADAFYFSNSGPRPTLYHKVESAFMHYFFNIVGKPIIQRNVYRVFDKYLPNKTLDIEGMSKERMKMMFTYQHFSLTGARALAPQLLEIGGIHIQKSKPLPKDLEEIVSSSEHGVIYVSFGSKLQASTMSKNKLQQFLDAFKKLPQKILMKWENDTLPAGNDNVYTSEWFPQMDLLCHPKVLGFVSHGGMLSMSEAAHCGKPMLAIPFFGDQFANAATVVASGLGNRLFFDRLNADNLAAAVQELTSELQQQKAEIISKMWHDRPLSAMDSAVYWAEYVARHGSAPPSLPARHQSWFEHLLIDVFCVVILLLMALISLCYITCKIIKSCCVRLCYKYINGKVKNE